MTISIIGAGAAGCFAGIHCPNAGFHSLRFQNDLLNFTLDGNGHIKIAGFKETENTWMRLSGVQPPKQPS